MSRISLTEQQLSRIIGRMLRESNVEDYAEAPALPDAKFGRIAFADQRKDLPPGLEPNLPFEDKFLYYFSDFVKYNDELMPEFVKAIRGFIDKGYYSNLFFYSEDPVLYRGIWFSEADVRRYLGGEIADSLPALGEGVRTVRTSMTIGSLKSGNLSSWTPDYEVALEFATAPQLDLTSQKPHYGIVLVATPSSNPKKFLDISKLYPIINSKFDWQQESIGLGPVKLSEMRIFRIEDSPLDFEKYWATHD